MIISNHEILEKMAEAREVNPDYVPKTVNTDGWFATRNAFSNQRPLTNSMSEWQLSANGEKKGSGRKR